MRIPRFSTSITRSSVQHQQLFVAVEPNCCVSFSGHYISLWLLLLDISTHTHRYTYIFGCFGRMRLCAFIAGREKAIERHTHRTRERANDSIEIVMVVVIAVHSHLNENVLMYLWIENSLYGWIHLNTPEKYIPNPDCA